MDIEYTCMHAHAHTHTHTHTPLHQAVYINTMTRRASHPQYTMGILRSRIEDKGPGIQVGGVMTLWGASVDVGRLRNP